MKKFFVLISLLLAASLALAMNVSARKMVVNSDNSDDSNSSPSLRMGFGLDGINTPAGPINALSARWDFGKMQIDGLLGFNSLSGSGFSTSTFGIGGQFGYILKSYQNLNIKFLGRLTFADVAPNVGNSSSLFGLGAGVGGEFFFPGIPNLGLEGGVLLNLNFMSTTGANSTGFGIGPLNPGITPGLAIHYYL